MGVSNNIIAVLNLIALLCSIPILASGIWLASQPNSDCVRLLRWPIIIIGALILLVSLAGFSGAFWNLPCLLTSFLILMALLIVLLLVLLVSAFVIAQPDGSYAVPGRGYREYRLGGYSDWIRDYVDDRWVRIVSCLRQSDVCGKLARRDEYFTAEQFFREDLKPIQPFHFLEEVRRQIREKERPVICCPSWDVFVSWLTAFVVIVRCRESRWIATWALVTASSFCVLRISFCRQLFLSCCRILGLARASTPPMPLPPPPSRACVLAGDCRTLMERCWRLACDFGWRGRLLLPQRFHPDTLPACCS